MLLVASQSELKIFDDEKRWEVQRKSTTSRLLDAYIVQDATIRDLNDKLARALGDAAVRLENATKLDALLRESEEDRAALHKQFNSICLPAQEKLGRTQAELERVPKLIRKICHKIWK